MADESMADEFKVEEYMAHSTIPWRIWHNYTYISYEILKYQRKRNECNINGGEILMKHVEDLGHDKRHRYKYILVNIIIEKSSKLYY